MITQYKSVITGIALLLGNTLSVMAQQAADPIISAMQKEIDRSIKELKIDKLPAPFYIDARVVNINATNIQATLGSLMNYNSTPYRNVYCSLLTGDYQKSNNNLLVDFPQGSYPQTMVFGTDEEAIRTCLWKQLDEKYKKGAEDYETKQSIIKQQALSAEELSIPDFEKKEPATYFQQDVPIHIDMEKLKKYVMDASAVFKDNKNLIDSSVRLYIGDANSWYTNSEGSKVQCPDKLVMLFINLQGQAIDGEELNQTTSLFYTSLEELPDNETLKKMCLQQGELFNARLQAPLIDESYCGPVLFEKDAVADLVNDYMVTPDKGILAKRKPIRSDEMNRYSGGSWLEGNQLEGMINKKVISRDLTLVSLSGTETYQGKKLFGYYPIDAQGVAPDKELVLIQEGVLKNMLTNRFPTKVFRHSNGHARAAVNGSEPFLLPGVLKLSSKNPVAASSLKQKLIDAAKEEDYEYAYIVRKKAGENAELLYRVNVQDGSETLVRGAQIKDMSLKTFKRILGVAQEEEIYNRSRHDVKMTFIVPRDILFEEVDVVKNNNIVLKKPYVVERPE
ncbi:metallopeptidase TldD-related protein [Parabacteroides pacaensis]|uniref:metallopeptidase TldD-related protein n=1 Tax=Parabacteroides pacaensis TaxID=2086575 RepID=UPI000D10269A|nr:metallopeptidase TldD-related protein [Parabacteroides pacaensis]